MDKRFKSEGEKKKYSIEKIWDHHRAIVRCLVASNGKFTNEQIAESIGCCAQTVSNVRNEPVVKEMIDALQERADDGAVDVAREIRKMFPIAAAVLTNTMRLAETEESVHMLEPQVLSQSVRAAVAVVDHAHPKQVHGAILHGHMTLAQIADIKEKVRRELGGSEVEDVKYSEVAEG